MAHTRHLFAALLFTFASTGAFAQEGTAEEAKTASLAISDDSFQCLASMTPVRGFFVDNLMGDLEGTLAVANSEKGGAYPPGSVVQLVPGEVMVKHPEGTSPVTKDWEFFELTATSEGSKIAKRGFVDVNNKFGGNCFACHIKAEPQWDMICETGHGCDPLPLTKDMLAVIQKTDPRCADKPTLTDKEKALFMQLQQLLK